MVLHTWSNADTRGEYAGFTAVCDDAYRHGQGQDDGEITVITFYLSSKLNQDAVAEFLELAMNDHRRQQRRQPEQPETQRQRRPIVLVGDFNVDVRKDDWIVRHIHASSTFVSLYKLGGRLAVHGLAQLYGCHWGRMRKVEYWGVSLDLSRAVGQYFHPDSSHPGSSWNGWVLSFTRLKLFSNDCFTTEPPLLMKP
ncbi:hypothetical protein HPB49_013570 [Dermacentor silvarum]|uniref:Uncharacterized protein n=1 Tax=Dermacentor silvarum TaxID=543639 RepID=A0ACB8E054_DERSI|nr:hypothetical protein HPB49_013570 [Dermacentor silvarum]